MRPRNHGNHGNHGCHAVVSPCKEVKILLLASLDLASLRGSQFETSAVTEQTKPNPVTNVHMMFTSVPLV